MRIFICDDDPAFCAVVGYWLTDHNESELVGSAQSRASAIPQLENQQPDVVLLDTMGHTSTEKLPVADIRASAPHAKVIVYSGLPERVAANFVEGRADLYLEKDCEPAHLIEALSEVMQA